MLQLWHNCNYEVNMKSVLISFLMFAAVIAAMWLGIFDLLASPYMLAGAGICVIAALIFAFKVLGNPLSKDNRNDEK